MTPSIKIENLSKQYRLGLVGTGTLIDDVNRWWHQVRGKEDPYLKIGEINDRSVKGNSKYIWALKDIEFEVQKGDVVGIIGKNGAGKSTLLKILSKVTAPTRGMITYLGRIGSLLEVGTGFNTELTGRENIFLNGAILGMRKSEIQRKFDEIVDFSGCSRYIDTPVKRYSSGMTVRLGFAVAAFLEPEILVVDEVLAVGDAEFQKKAVGKMQEVSRNEGRTVLFVSHNMGAVRNLCKKGIVLENGTLVYNGSIAGAIECYMKEQFFEDGSILDGAKPLNGMIRISDFKINNSSSNIVNIDSKNNLLNFSIRGEVDSPMKISLEVRVYDSNKNLLGIFSPGHLRGEVPLFKGGSFSINETLAFPANTTKGDFYLEISLSQPNLEFLVQFPKYIKVVSEGIYGASGLSFDYNGSGFLMF